MKLNTTILLNRRSNWSKRYILLSISVFFLFMYISPYLRSDTHILIHDYLDSNHVWAKAGAEELKALQGDDSTDARYFKGLPIRSEGPIFSLRFWLFYFFNPYVAHVIGQILVRVLAFVGMLLLIKHHFVQDKNDNLVVFGVALTFSLLPYYPPAGLSVAGQPLALYAFLNFRNKQQSLKDWLILILIPFYASLVLSFLFFIIAVSVLWLYDLIVQRKLNYQFLAAIAVMAGLFVFVEYRLFYAVFFESDYVSHRVEFGSEKGGAGLGECIRKVQHIFFNGQYHAASLHRNYILPAVVIALSFVLVKGLEARLMFWLLGIVALTSGIYGLWGWQGMSFLKENIGVFAAFQFSRFHFLQPLLWYLLFALSLKLLVGQMQRYGKYVALAFLILQLALLFYQHDAIQERNKPSYREFYAPDLFSEIKAHIGRPQQDYRVISLGLHPAISQYNGFYTLDSYSANYPLSYKHEFRKIIAGELEKDDDLRVYFDNWGSRCYAFSAELGRNYLSNDHPVVQQLDFDFEQIKRMGGKYIISSAEIDTINNNALSLSGVFSNDESHWTIYLYEVQ
jgi:hypothetical protein